MEKGLNSDIQINGNTYHVQTEDWGPAHRLVVSHVFRSGAIVKSVRTSYDSLFLEGRKSDTQTIRLAIKEQHHQILDLLISGQF
ncbi:MAG: hypothetical protein A4S09_01710 [Proteobacteria bacterium SG_bin7]|nr:MAG: hypothetical protein A4S09_01710 [Proteobacteria bacterium SG_bin7]